MSSAKENNAAVGNTPTKSTMLKNVQLDRVARCSLGPPNKACSPVREEDDEQFSSGDCAIQKLTRDHDRARKAEIEHQRRQSYAAGARRKLSIGGRQSLGGFRKDRRSIGGSGPEMVKLQEELTRVQKLQTLRQDRLNKIGIEKGDLETKLAKMDAKYNEIKKVRDANAKQVIEMKKKMRHLEAYVRRLEEKNSSNEKTIAQLLTKVRTGGLKTLHKRGAVPKKTGKKQDNKGKTTDADKKGPSKSAADKERNGDAKNTTDIEDTTASQDLGKRGDNDRDDDEEEEEEFGDAKDIVGAMKRPMEVAAQDAANARRYTMAPGEASRLTNKFGGSIVPGVKETHTVRVEGLAKGLMSKDLYEMCQPFGRITACRVTKCGTTGDLRGYVVYSQPVMARNATRELRNKGYGAFRVDDV